MSESQNVAVVQQAYAAFGRGDIPAILALLNQNVDWEALVGAGSQVPMGGRRVGKVKVAEFFSTLGANSDFQVFDPKEFIAQGDKVVALGHYEGTAKPTGRRFASDWAMVFTVRDGLVVHFREYADTANVIAAFASPART